MLKLKPLIAAKAKESYKSNVGRPSKSPQNSATISNVETRKELSKLAGVSHDTISRIEKIAAKAKENQLRTSENRVRANSPRQEITTREELSKLAGIGSNTIPRIEKIAAKAKENLVTHTKKRL